jgi:GNAT superfamily N-acetyltransferase
MPILGMNVPDALVLQTREVLIRRINANFRIHEVFKGHDLVLRRIPYTGDYTIRGRTSESGFFPIARFGMLPMPGCRAICIFHHVEVDPAYRHLGIGTELLRIRIDTAKEVGYKMVLATVRDENIAEIKLLNAAGFEAEIPFDNKGHSVSLRRKIL